MEIRIRRSIFETRVDILDAINSLGEQAISSRIASVAAVGQRTLQIHLAFLQVKDLVTVADHTIEDREKLQKRSKSSIFRLTPEGKRILSVMTPLRNELTSDKQQDWMEALKKGERWTDALLTT